MRSLRIMAALALTVGIVVAPSIATAAPLSAPMASSVSMGTPPPDFTPSGSKWRQYMLNIAGGVLGAAMPRGWRAEQIANQHKWGNSPDALAAATGIGAGSPLDRIPETIEDYYAQEYERQQQRNRTATGTGPVRAPATPGAKLIKTVGGVATAVTGLEIGTTLGGAGMNLVGGWFGWDVNGTVCSQVAGTPGEPLTSWVTGQDCSAWELDAGYIPNEDAGTAWEAASWNGGSITFKGFTEVSGVRNGACYLYTPPASFTNSNGEAVGVYVELRGEGYNWEVGAPIVVKPPATGESPNDASVICRKAGYTHYHFNSTVTHSTSGGVLVFRERRVNGPVVSNLPTETVQDPDRTLACTVTFTDGTSATSSGDPYKESEGGITAPQCPPTPEGKVPDSIAITENGGAEPRELFKQDTTADFQEWAGDFPECADGTCMLDLVKITPGAVVSCFDLSGGCPGWFEDPNKAETYRCVYGSEDVGLAECAVYSGLFTPGRVEVGAPYSDPMTGTWSGGSSTPKPDQQAMGQQVQNPAATYRSCDGMNVTGFDPVGFVMRPIQCALEWAFAPRPLVVEAAFTRANLEWANKPPAVIANAAETFAMTPQGTGCSQSVTLFGITFPIIDVCEGTAMATVASISRIVTALGMVVLVIVVVKRQIAAMVNYNQGQG